MRIAHIITRMIVGGAQENTLYTCEDLRRTYGDDVLLVTGPALGPEGVLMEQGRGEGVPTAVIAQMRRAIHPARDSAAYRALKQVLSEFKPDVVHTHSAKGGFLGRLAAWSLDVPAVIHTVHGAPFHPFQNRVARSFFQFCERYAARRCHAMISVADAMTDLMVDAGIAPRSKFTTIYSGMDVDPFLRANERRSETRRDLGFAPEHVVVGKIARLFHLKGHDDLLEAAQAVAQRHPQVRFLLVGDGILRPKLAERIQRMGLADRFHFTGLVPPERVPQLIGAIDVLVHVSLREGLARALPQALIAGKPVISYDIDGAREVVHSNETGILVPPRDLQSLERAIETLVSDSELRGRLGRCGQQRYTDRFRHEAMTSQIRELYERVLGGSSLQSSAV